MKFITCINLRLLSHAFLAMFSSASLAAPASAPRQNFIQSLPIPESVKGPGKAELCEDFMPAACFNPQGEYRTNEMHGKIVTRLQSIVEDALNVGAKSIGFSNRKDAIIKSLSQEGYKLRPDLSSAAQNFLVSQTYTGYVEKSQIYQVASECAAESKKITEINPYNLLTQQEIEKAEKQIGNFNSKYQSIIKLGYVRDLPSLFTQLNQKCMEITSQIETAKKNTAVNQELLTHLEKTCANRKSVREKIVKLYVANNTPEAQKEKEQLVESIYEMMKLQLSRHSILPSQNSDPLFVRKQVLQNSILENLNLCNEVDRTYESGPRKVIEEVNDKVTTARATVEYLIDAHYNETRKTQALKIYDEVRKEVLNFVRELTRDPVKLQKIESNYNRMTFNWFKKPEARYYKKDPKTGVEHLDTKLFSPGSAWHMMFALNLEFFTSLNAFYLPDSQYGAEKSALSVTMQPMFLELIKENPWSMMSVLAHELGHNIDPRVSRINGHDLTPEYENLNQCLSSSTSIRMREDQSGESISDYISAYVVSRLANQLPSSLKKSAIVASVQSYCYFNSYNERNNILMLDVGHPDPYFRLSGIYGGSESLRKVMGCQSESRQFRTCSLQGGKP